MSNAAWMIATPVGKLAIYEAGRAPFSARCTLMRLWLVVCRGAASMFGPVGLLLHHILRVALGARTPSATKVLL